VFITQIERCSFVDQFLEVCEIHEWKSDKLTCLVNFQGVMSLMAQLGLLLQPTGL
jgi:hypothetical protein